MCLVLYKAQHSGIPSPALKILCFKQETQGEEDALENQAGGIEAFG